MKEEKSMDEKAKDSIMIDTEIKNAIKATDKDAQYDESAKRLLGNKRILAHILLKYRTDKEEIGKLAFYSDLRGKKIAPIDEKLLEYWES